MGILCANEAKPLVLCTSNHTRTIGAKTSDIVNDVLPTVKTDDIPSLTEIPSRRAKHRSILFVRFMLLSIKPPFHCLYFVKQTDTYCI